MKLWENFDGEEEERGERRVAEELRAAIGAITAPKCHQELIRLILEFRTTLRFPTSLGLSFWASFSIIINMGHLFLQWAEVYCVSFLHLETQNAKGKSSNKLINKK